MSSCLDKIKNQLELMTEEEKDAWFLSQMKLLAAREQENYYKSMCGVKKVTYMPEYSEIADFCDKVHNGYIALEYETHYVEFDEFGHFHDDWEYDFYDPHCAMRFVTSVVDGCHDLIRLEEYDTALEILDNIISLEFAVEDHPDTDDCCEYEHMDLNNAIDEGILSINRERLLYDYIEACCHMSKSTADIADKIAALLEIEIFWSCNTDLSTAISKDNPVWRELRKKLTENLEKFENDFKEKSKEDEHYWGYYSDKKRIDFIKEMMKQLEHMY